MPLPVMERFLHAGVPDKGDILELLQEQHRQNERLAPLRELLRHTAGHTDLQLRIEREGSATGLIVENVELQPNRRRPGTYRHRILPIDPARDRAVEFQLRGDAVTKKGELESVVHIHLGNLKAADT